MSDSIIEVTAFSLVRELRAGVALAGELHTRLTDSDCAAAHEQIQAIQAAARALLEAAGTELAAVEHYEAGARESNTLCFCKRCKALRSAAAAQASRDARLAG